jgi:hypothetical protein
MISSSAKTGPAPFSSAMTCACVLERTSKLCERPWPEPCRVRSQIRKGTLREHLPGHRRARAVICFYVESSRIMQLSGHRQTSATSLRGYPFGESFNLSTEIRAEDRDWARADEPPASPRPRLRRRKPAPGARVREAFTARQVGASRPSLRPSSGYAAHGQRGRVGSG